MSILQRLRCRVAAILEHGERVYTVDLLPERMAPRFRPGQFLHLALDPYDPSRFWPESRVFSIASSPGQRDRLRISYSVKGEFTARMERELYVGRDVWVKLPYGDFVIGSERDIVLFVGGTGITAFVAFLEGLTTGFPHRVTLFYGARSSQLLLYREMITARVDLVSQFRAVYFVEQCAMQGQLLGKLSVEAALPYLERVSQTDYYLSGPPSMLETLSGQLKDCGIQSQAIHVDAWG